nr:hypothetical protein MFLOJ_58630 [Mycobacterium florentinum]
MLQTVATRGYRSLREVILPLGRLSIITGANGAGKSSVYRALRLLADCGRGEVIGSLAREGGLQSVLWAGPERLDGARRTQRTEGAVHTRPVSLEMGFAAHDFGYLVDLGLPQSAGKSVFARDPEIKREVLFAGPVLRPSATLVRRSRGFAEAVNSGNGFDELSRSLPLYRSVLAEYANPHALPELAAVRERLRGWRFYDGFRVDGRAPARHPQVGTRTPVLSDDGSDLAAAIQTILESGSDELSRVIADALAFACASSALRVHRGRGRSACRSRSRTPNAANAHSPPQPHTQRRERTANLITAVYQPNSWSVKAHVRSASLSAHKRHVSSAYARCTGR